jgi:hypothetical protein
MNTDKTDRSNAARVPLHFTVHEILVQKHTHRVWAPGAFVVRR